MEFGGRGVWVKWGVGGEIVESKRGVKDWIWRKLFNFLIRWLAFEVRTSRLLGFFGCFLLA